MRSLSSRGTLAALLLVVAAFVVVLGLLPDDRTKATALAPGEPAPTNTGRGEDRDEDRLQASANASEVEEDEAEVPVTPEAAAEGLVHDDLEIPARRSLTNSSSRLRCRIVDARTKEPVSDATVVIRRGGETVARTTDVAGWANGAVPGTTGRLHLRIEDAGKLLIGIGRLEEDAWVPGPLVAEVPLGPTVPLSLPQASKTAWHTAKARIVETAPHSDVAGRLEVGERGLILGHGTNDLPDRTWSWLPLREGPHPWVRYPSIEHEPAPGYETWIEVWFKTPDRLGAGLAAGVVGIRPVVEIEAVDPYRSVSGIVVREDGNPMSRATVLLLPPDAGDGQRTTPIWERTRIGKDGCFFFGDVAQGRRKMVVFEENYHVFAEHIEVGAGSMVLDPIVLRWEREYQRIGLGYTERESVGRDRLRTQARLTEAGPFARVWSTLDGYVAVDPKQRRLGIHSLPVGEYELECIGYDGPPCVRLSESRVDSPYKNLDLPPIPSSEFTRFEFDAIDARTGEFVSDARAFFGPGGEVWSHYGWKPGLARFELPRNCSLRWMVEAPGYAPAFGDESAFEDTEEGPRAHIVLEPGWGTELHFRAGSPREILEDPWPWDWTFPTANGIAGILAAPPLPHVRVEVDGLPAGSSDSDGRLAVALKAVPQELTVLCDGWRVVGVNRAANERWAYRQVVWLARDRSRPRPPR